jgi:hypothetical protein
MPGIDIAILWGCEGRRPWGLEWAITNQGYMKLAGIFGTNT